MTELLGLDKRWKIVLDYTALVLGKIMACLDFWWTLTTNCFTLPTFTNMAKSWLENRTFLPYGHTFWKG